MQIYDLSCLQLPDHDDRLLTQPGEGQVAVRFHPTGEEAPEYESSCLCSGSTAGV